MGFRGLLRCRMCGVVFGRKNEDAESAGQTLYPGVDYHKCDPKRFNGIARYGVGDYIGAIEVGEKLEAPEGARSDIDEAMGRR